MTRDHNSSLTIPVSAEEDAAHHALILKLLMMVVYLFEIADEF